MNDKKRECNTELSSFTLNKGVRSEFLGGVVHPLSDFALYTKNGNSVKGFVKSLTC